MGVAQGGREDVFGGVRVAVRRAMPEAPAEGGHIDPVGILRVGDHPVAPFEVIAPQPLPGRAPIRRLPDRGAEAAGVEGARVAGVYGHIVDILILRQDVAPSRSGVHREEDAAVLRLAVRIAPPGRQIEPSEVLWVAGEAVGAVDPARQGYSGPVLRAICRAIERAIT